VKVLEKTNTFLLVSIEQKEILKKLRKYKKINLFHSKKSELLKIFKSKIKVIFASGGIVENSKKQILFIYRKGKWDLPKGKAEKNETIRETALREVTEETGISRLRIRKFYTNTFHLVRNNGSYFLKETSWFLMYSDFEGKLIPQSEEGIKNVKWKNLNQVKKIKEKTFRNIKIILEEYLKSYQ
jgi:8-oxo-dGTP pyrophosphatase MutT (NUDIX family)